MDQHDVVDLLNSAECIGITIWVGGGWGVDALVGSQTRPHGDIDIYIQKHNADAIIKILISRNYSEIKTDYTNEVHTVWQSSPEQIVDLHCFEWKRSNRRDCGAMLYPRSSIAFSPGV